MSDEFNVQEMLDEIGEHFKNISIEEFEQNLERAGVRSVGDPSSQNMEMAPPEYSMIGKVFEKELENKSKVYDVDDKFFKDDFSDYKAYKEENDYKEKGDAA